MQQNKLSYRSHYVTQGMGLHWDWVWEVSNTNSNNMQFEIDHNGENGSSRLSQELRLLL